MNGQCNNSEDSKEGYDHSNIMNGQCNNSEDSKEGYDQQLHTALKLYYICTGFERIWNISL